MRKGGGYLEAYKWGKLAAAQGYEGARQNSEALLLKLSPEQAAGLEPEDKVIWRNKQLTPIRFSEFVGQERTKARLEMAVAAARNRKEPLGHVLLIGEPGVGKATLAAILAAAMGANLKSFNGLGMKKAGDLAGLLTMLEAGDVLFIDEIHRLRRFIANYFFLR